MALVMSLSSEMKGKSTIFFPDIVKPDIMSFIKKNGEIKTLSKGELITILSLNLLMSSYPTD
jgi:hypothetical protein